MTKTYKHKKLGWIAKERTDGLYRIHKQDGELEKDINDFISPQLIENSNDWIEDKQDWIDKVFDMYNGGQEINGNDIYFRECIEKHIPKVSEEELMDINFSNGTDGYGNLEFNIDKKSLIELLKQKGLYLDK